MRRIDWIAWLLLPLLAGCASQPLAPDAGTRDLTLGDAQAIGRSADTMDACLELIHELQARRSQQQAFFLPREQDALEWSLAEYLSARSGLQESASRDSAEVRRASLQLRTERDIRLATLALEDATLWRALNQSFHRSAIPKGSCDRILDELTASQSSDLDDRTRQEIGDLIRRRSLLLPAVENGLRHSPPTQLLFASSRVVSTQWQRGQAVVVAGTGRLKNPVIHPLTFPEEQARQIRNALRPGDILLTYSAGYASNLFIPGNFKHAATFVGTASERRRADLPDDKLLAAASPNNQHLAQTLQQATIPSGEAADVVESVAEGVLLNNFQKILTTRINRLVVLRPRLNHGERCEQLADVLSYVGDEYDFAFDLTDASDQVCTEVVYRSLHGRGGIELPLSDLAGRKTLTADDLLRYYRRSGPNEFTCVLAVDEAPQSTGMARVLQGRAALEWIDALPGIVR